MKIFTLTTICMIQCALFVSIILGAVILIIQINLAKARAEEQWPKRTPAPLGAGFTPFIDLPPYPNNSTIVLSRPALFFKRRQDLDVYRLEPNKLNHLVESKFVTILQPGRRVKTIEVIKGTEGQITDQQLGDGYIIMKLPF